MHFKHLTAKAKGSLFLILLFTIAIGVVVAINNGNNKNSVNSNKRINEANSSKEGKKSKNNTNENNPPETDVPSKQSSSTGGDGIKETPTLSKPDEGTVDGGEYNNNFHGRVEVYENSYFGMKVNFPKDWILGDKHEQLVFNGPFDPKRVYLFTTYSLTNTVGVYADRFEEEANDFLNGIKENPGVYQVIGSNKTQSIPVLTSEIKALSFNGADYVYIDLSIPEGYLGMIAAYKRYNSVIVFKINGSDEKEVHQTMEELLRNTDLMTPLFSSKLK